MCEEASVQVSGSNHVSMFAHVEDVKATFPGPPVCLILVVLMHKNVIVTLGTNDILLLSMKPLITRTPSKSGI